MAKGGILLVAEIGILYLTIYMCSCHVFSLLSSVCFLGASCSPLFSSAVGFDSKHKA